MKPSGTMGANRDGFFLFMALQKCIEKGEGKFSISHCQCMIKDHLKHSESSYSHLGHTFILNYRNVNVCLSLNYTRLVSLGSGNTDS